VAVLWASHSHSEHRYVPYCPRAGTLGNGLQRRNVEREGGKRNEACGRFMGVLTLIPLIL
jgi:hypothetical protein